MKKIISAVLLICLIAALCPAATADAHSARHTTCADALYELGLFRGTGTDSGGNPVYDLEKEATRAEMIVMLIRLLGLEGEALAHRGSHPFKDVPSSHWADRYIAFCYSRGYVSGMTATEFCPSTTSTANMYLTLILRALGFDDSVGDFSYATAYLKSAEIGLSKRGEYVGSPFYRDDITYVSYRALGCNMKGKTNTLAQELISQGVIDSNTVSRLGLSAGHSGHRENSSELMDIIGIVALNYCNRFPDDGDYVIFSHEVFRSGNEITVIVRYQMSYKEAQAIIAAGGTLISNILADSVTINMLTGDATGDNDSWNLWEYWDSL